MENKKIIRFGGATPIINLYPSDLHDIVALDADLRITTTWGDDVIGTIIPTYNPDTKEFIKYSIRMERGEELCTEVLEPLEAITIFAGKTVSMRKQNPPKGLRNKVSFALGMNREKRVKSMDELQAIYKEQLFLHDETILNDLAVTEKAYMPVRFDFGNFHIITLSDGYGQFTLADGYFYMDGFLNPTEALNILDNVPPKCVDLRKVEWVKTLIKTFPEDDSLQHQKYHNNRGYNKPEE